MKTIREAYVERNAGIYDAYLRGWRQKEIASLNRLSVSRVKAIIAAMKGKK